MFILLRNVRRIASKYLGGLGIGKKFPFLWRIYDWVAGFQDPFIHPIQGFRMWINPKDRSYLMRLIGHDYASMDVYEPATTKIFREHIKPGDVVLDIGASMGYFSMLAGSLGAMVYAFEPTKINFNYLCQNVILNEYESRVFPHECAAYSKNHIVRMPVNASPVNACWANGVNLDDWLEQQGITKVDFVKIDTDGSEPHVLKGLERTIKNNPNLKMVCEYYPKCIEMAGGNPLEVKEILDKYFDCTIIEGDYTDQYYNLFCRRKHA